MNDFWTLSALTIVILLVACCFGFTFYLLMRGCAWVMGKAVRAHNRRRRQRDRLLPYTRLNKHRITPHFRLPT